MGKPDIVKELEPLFKPRSVAVIGATNNVGKWGFSTFFSLESRFEGDLFAVNNRDPEILGHKAYKRVTDIPSPVDLAVIVIPPDKVAGVMEDCVEKGIKAGVIITAGFAEVGPAGKAMQDEVVGIAKKGGIRLVGPNCMGMWSAPANLSAFMFPLPILEGPLALISQGGNVGGAMVSDAASRGIGFQQYVSCGGTADIQIEDYIEYLGHDDKVKVIMVYIEGLGDGHRFVEKVREVTAKKPVVALKPGKTDAAVKAISSHSGSLSGTDTIYDAAFKKAGVIRTDTTMEMLDVAIGFLTQPLPKGPNVVITTPGGSYGVMAADACASRGLNVIDLPPAVMDKFDSMFPSRWSHGNPVDPAGDRNFIQYIKAPEILLRHPEVEAVLFMGFGSMSGMSQMLSSARGEGGRRMEGLKTRMEGIQEMARENIERLDSDDPAEIRQAVQAGFGMMFSSFLMTQSADIEEFIELVSEALTSEKMKKGPFFTGLKELFQDMSADEFDPMKLVGIMGLMDPLLDGLINYWMEKYDKPLLTTTFTERTSQMGEGGHFPYPNAERASTVLAKLLEYKEYLDGLAAETDLDD